MKGRPRRDSVETERVDSRRKGEGGGGGGGTLYGEEGCGKMWVRSPGPGETRVDPFGQGRDDGPLGKQPRVSSDQKRHFCLFLVQTVPTTTPDVQVDSV